MIDPERVREALRLHCERQHPARAWRVWRGSTSHLVRAIGEDLVCDCAHRRGSPCAHRLRVQFSRLGWQTVAALRELVTVGERAGA